MEAKQASVAFEEFADEEEGIHCHDAIADEAGDVVRFGVALFFDEDTVPECGELGVVFFKFVEQFILALADFLQCAVFSDGFLNGQHILLFTEEEGGEEVDEGFLDPGFAEGEDHDEEDEVDESHDEEGQRGACVGGQPVGECKGEEHQDCDDDQDEEDGQGSRRQ